MPSFLDSGSRRRVAASGAGGPAGSYRQDRPSRKKTEAFSHRRRDLAESYYELDETPSAEALFRGWLNLNPRGWGWIDWSDCYRFAPTELRDWGTSEQLLSEGLAMANVRDRSALAERLADLCEEQGRAEEAKPIAAAMETSLNISSAATVLRQRTEISFGGEGLPLIELSNVAAMLRGTSSPVTVGRPKVGRNNPCPCGSGTKFTNAADRDARLCQTGARQTPHTLHHARSQSEKSDLLRGQASRRVTPWTHQPSPGSNKAR